MRQRSGMDASLVYLETPDTPMHIGSVAIYDRSTAPGGQIRSKDILGHIEARPMPTRKPRKAARAA